MSRAAGITAMNAMLQMSAPGKRTAGADDSLPACRIWATTWSVDDNQLMMGKRIQALLKMGIEIPADMRDFAEKLNVSFMEEQ